MDFLLNLPPSFNSNAMTSKPAQSFLRSVHRRAFTVVELLVAISVLTLIVLVLFGLFDQVQKALLGNVAQVDVLEGGRAQMQLMSAEIEQMAAGNVAGNTNLYIRMTATPYEQALVNANEVRTNILQGLVFLTHSNKSWFATSYKVLVFTNKAGNPFYPDVQFADRVGTIGRYSLKISDSDFGNTNLVGNIMKLLDPALSPTPNIQLLTNYQPIVDGVVHFRVHAYDTNGFLMNYLTNVASVRMTYDPLNLVPSGSLAAETRYAFTNSAVPSYLEVEMGILEPRVLERYKSFPNPVVASNYLARQSAAVHLFQQRIPIRAAR
jgi:competence protein ComGC